MALGEILTLSACLVTDEQLTRDALLRRMVVRLGVRDVEATLLDIIRREETMTTAMDLGVAVPHCFRPGVGGPKLAVSTLSRGVDFHAPGGALTHVVFLLVEDTTGRAGHVALMSHIATLCRTTTVLERLRAATGVQQIPAVLAECEAEIVP